MSLRRPLNAAAIGASALLCISSSPSTSVLAYTTIYASALSPFRAAHGRSRSRGSNSRSLPLCMVPPSSSPGPRGDPEGEGTHTYVEGLNFGSKEEELLAKGGDPFFLDDDDDDDDEQIEDIGEEYNDKEAAMPSMAFMSNIASLPGTLDVVGRGSDPSTSSSSISSSSSSSSSSSIEEEYSVGGSRGRASSIPFDPAVGAGGLHSRPEGEGFDDQRDALLDIGGDPFFMQDDNDDDEGVDVDEGGGDKFDPVDEVDLWDGWAVEDAHLDFD